MIAMDTFYLAARKRVFQILDVAKEGDTISQIFDIFIMLLISFNVIAVIFESVEALFDRYSTFFRVFEIVSVMIFTIEYILRIWSCTIDQRYEKPLSGRVKFSLTPLLVIDLLAIIPFYLPIVFALDLRFLRAIRLIRLFRLLKMARYSETIKTFGRVLRAKKEDLLITVFALSILLIVASSLMYFFESDVQPQAFSSIPAAMWWGVATLTTVGYGDVYPITVAGKILGAIISILGIGLFALPAGIIGSGFVDEMQKKRGRANTCPHCGKEIR